MCRIVWLVSFSFDILFNACTIGEWCTLVYYSRFGLYAGYLISYFPLSSPLSLKVDKICGRIWVMVKDDFRTTVVTVKGHLMQNWVCTNCGKISEDTGFSDGCKFKLEIFKHQPYCTDGLGKVKKDDCICK